MDFNLMILRVKSMLIDANLRLFEYKYENIVECRLQEVTNFYKYTFLTQENLAIEQENRRKIENYISK